MEFLNENIVLTKRKNFFDKGILIYDIEALDCYTKLINEKNYSIFEAIKEAMNWIQGEIELIESNVKEYSEIYSDTGRSIRILVKSYNSLRRKHENQTRVC